MSDSTLSKYFRRQAFRFVVPGACTLCYNSLGLWKLMCEECQDFAYCSDACMMEDKLSHDAYCRGFAKVTKKMPGFGLEVFNYGAEPTNGDGGGDGGDDDDGHTSGVVGESRIGALRLRRRLRPRRRQNPIRRRPRPRAIPPESWGSSPSPIPAPSPVLTSPPGSPERFPVEPISVSPRGRSSRGRINFAMPLLRVLSNICQSVDQIKPFFGLSLNQMTHRSSLGNSASYKKGSNHECLHGRLLQHPMLYRLF